MISVEIRIPGSNVRQEREKQEKKLINENIEHVLTNVGKTRVDWTMNLNFQNSDVNFLLTFSTICSFKSD